MKAMKRSIFHKSVLALLCGLALLAGGLVACRSGGESGAADTTGAETTGEARGGGEKPAVLVGAGDIARCDGEDDEATARIIEDVPGTVFTLGDNAYEEATEKEFAECYDPSWGRFKDRTRPAVGNHEYAFPGAEGHFSYFGEAAGEPGRGYYSYRAGDWKVIVLNSNCSEVEGGCMADSPQDEWLRAELESSDAACTLAYFHHPRYSSGEEYGDDLGVRPFWKALYEHGADVVMSAHEHSYERFAPQDPFGNADPEGIRQFVVGTGGGLLYGFDEPRPNSEVRKSGVHGVLKLTLHESSYDWEFLPVEGETFEDSGTGRCVA